mmetsp:Transcript_65945/g.212716  ORF Transcript_65945/g.212716 Transcript_65945/m.212716 type:complete len:205 (+) Transcript_65945:546-1160(+)
MVDGAALRPPDCARLPGRAQGAAAHADADRIGPSVQQRLRLAWGHDVAADDIEAGKGVLHLLQEVDLLHGVALRGVEHQGVGARLHELPHPLVLLRPRGASCGHQELVVGVRGGTRVCPALLQVSAADDRDELAGLVEDGELPPLACAELLLRLREGDGLQAHLHLGLGRHHISELRLPVLDEVEVAARDDAQEPAAHFAALGD